MEEARKMMIAMKSMMMMIQHHKVQASQRQAAMVALPSDVGLNSESAASKADGEKENPAPVVEKPGGASSKSASILAGLAHTKKQNEVDERDEGKDERKDRGKSRSPVPSKGRGKKEELEDSQELKDELESLNKGNVNAT